MDGRVVPVRLVTVGPVRRSCGDACRSRPTGARCARGRGNRRWSEDGDAEERPLSPLRARGEPAVRGDGIVLFCPRGTCLAVARPVAAGVLTILGGFFIVVGGLVFALIGAVFAILGFFSGIFLLGLLVGVLTILVGFLMLAIPSGHTVWGVLAIVLALVSIPVAFGGFLIGFLLALVGGILAWRWKRPVERVITVEARVIPPSAP